MAHTLKAATVTPPHMRCGQCHAPRKVYNANDICSTCQRDNDAITEEMRNAFGTFTRSGWSLVEEGRSGKVRR